MSSTPAPPPTPTPANYKKFDDLQGDQAFESVGVTTVLKVGGGDPTSISLEKRTVGQGLPVRYLVGPDRIAIDTSAGGTYTFLAAEYDPVQSTDDTKIYSSDFNAVWLGITTPKFDGVPLTYTRLMIFTRSVPSDGLQINIDMAAFGVLTKPNDLPRNGSASYTTMVRGALWTSPEDFDLSGYSTSTLTANFGPGTVATTINLVGKGLSTGDVQSFGELQGNGTISGISFSGDFENVIWGGFAGAFFGPQAAEVGYGFSAQTNNHTIFGVAAGRR